MKTIICPTDFSTCADNAAIYAAELAREFDSRLILFHIYENPLTFAEPSVVTTNEGLVSIMELAWKNMIELKYKLLAIDNNLKIETLIEDGSAPEQIIHIAVREVADAIVMGITGKSRLERVFMGSTTVKVIDQVACAVFIIPDEAQYQGIKKIVFATDLKSDNLNSATHIATFAKHFNSEIIFVYVENKEHGQSDEIIDEMTRKIRKHMKYEKMSGYVAKSTDVTEGISYFLEKNPADLVVMFSHQKHFPKTLFKPSVTKKMSAHILIPLLSLPLQSYTLAGAQL